MWMGGGVEQHTRTLIENTPGVSWSGLVAMGPHFVDQSKLSLMNRLLPAGGPGLLDQVLAMSDVLIVWGFNEPQAWLEQYQKKVIAVAHGTGTWTAKQLAITVPRAAGFVAVSDLAATSFPESVRDRVKVIPNGVDLNRIAPTTSREAIREKLQLEAGQVVIGHVGRLSEEKNPLAAAMAASAYGGQAVALYVGDGPCGRQIYDQACQVAPGQCRWIREPESIGDIYRALDVLVMTSPAEGGPLVVPEAWAAGVPVVATPVGMIPALEAKHGPLTWKVGINPSATELARACMSALTAGETGAYWLAKAREVVFTELNSTKFGADWESYLLEVAG
jgi:glycosyltransferase involved in cell wall biosynthesis